MKDTHLIIALYRALDRFGTSALPEGDEVPGRRTAQEPPHRDRRRAPGWVSVAEIEASQSPNTYPKLTQAGIRVRCAALASRSGSPVLRIAGSASSDGSWVLVAPPGDAEGGDAPTESDPVERDAGPPADTT